MTMRDKFPYFGQEITVTKSMCDQNGHMNVRYYSHVFDDASSELYHDMGFTSDYLIQGYSVFTLEMNIKYLGELKEGDKASTFFRIVNVNPRLIHLGGVLITDDGELSCVNEQILAHVDMNARKTSDMPVAMQKNLHEILENHKETGDLGFDLRLGIKK